MSDLTVKNVDLFGDTVIAAQDQEGKIWAGVKWLCEGLGLTEGQTKSEKKRIQEDLVLSKGGRNFVLPTKGGKQDVLCIRHDFVPLWLAKITITPAMKETNPDLVDKLVKYQLQAKDVLAEAFLPKEIPNDQLSPELQMFGKLYEVVARQELKQKEQEQKMEQLDNKIDSIKDVVALNPNDWRKDTSKIISRIALHIGGYEHIRQIREDSYKILEERMGVALNIRLTNKKKTMSLNGVCKSKIDKLNQLDVIADDKKLIEGYVAVIKDMAIKYGLADAEVA